MTATLEAPSGLEGLVVTTTAIGDVRGDEGYFHYRGRDATELARHHSLEEVWHLLVVGHLPDPAELDRFTHCIGQARRQLSPALVDDLVALATGDDGMAKLRTLWSHAATALGCRPWGDLTPADRLDQALTLSAIGPVLVAASHGIHAEVAELPDGTAAALLSLVDGSTGDPQSSRSSAPSTDDVATRDQAVATRDQAVATRDQAVATRGQAVAAPDRAVAAPDRGARIVALERYLVLTLDHGLNASTFTARTVTSTGADLGAVLVAALGALSGPLHGGAPSRALDMLDAIGTPEHAEPWVRDTLARGERIMGFGHRVYRTEDPRARLLRDTARELGGPRIDLALHVEEVVRRLLRELKPDRVLDVNVEYHAAIVLDAVGLPRTMFTPTFAMARSIGWMAHALEQMEGNRIVRPSSRYAGPNPHPTAA